MSKILDFYSDANVVGPEGMALNDIWGMSLDEMEGCHFYIQWLFPLPQDSSFHPNSPVLITEDIKTFKRNKELQRNLFMSFEKYLDFMGIEYNRIYNKIGINPKTYPKRKPIWTGIGNHNNLRISRILACMTLLGLKHWSNMLYDFLIAHVKPNVDANMDTFGYWSLAVRGIILPPEPVAEANGLLDSNYWVNPWVKNNWLKDYKVD